MTRSSLLTSPHLYMRQKMVRNVLLETASTLDNRKLLLLFVVVTVVILVDYEFGLVSDFIPDISPQVKEYRSLSVLP